MSLFRGPFPRTIHVMRFPCQIPFGIVCSCQTGEWIACSCATYWEAEAIAQQKRAAGHEALVRPLVIWRDTVQFGPSCAYAHPSDLSEHDPDRCPHHTLLSREEVQQYSVMVPRKEDV